MKGNLRILISCVTFETVKIVKPIEFFRADKAYLLHQAVKQPYIDFINEVKRQLVERNVEYECIEVEVNKFDAVIKELISIIRKEKKDGNCVYVNIGAGSSIYSSASLMACLMEGGIPFNVGVKLHMVKDTKPYYEGSKPVGIAKEVYDPIILPGFKLQRPPEKLVMGMKLWNEIHGNKGRGALKEVISKIQEHGLLIDCLDERGKVTHRGQMRFIRKFRNKWIKMGWMEKDDDDGAFRLSEYGEMILRIF